MRNKNKKQVLFLISYGTPFKDFKQKTIAVGPESSLDDETYSHEPTIKEAKRVAMTIASKVNGEVTQVVSTILREKSKS